ncbi:uncharacterized protein YjbI with pentapeptide repeats [Thermocatellispora tengchongensis]|uniref:Uncharacterized protein YjbI with pentapeptide repeats n=1 Tax=Thermocatellispora tengchongensis TaxID=1073253 RepID=A0A840PA18_9ACTN|nr:pentapeptide repeat-containing protein [Thermocatellispora tengchongensis]MBB5134701.1 uncharacterized protein YjbI with pentapeptide repeats [Thermocatellispora tengchongensis]
MRRTTRRVLGRALALVPAVLLAVPLAALSLPAHAATAAGAPCKPGQGPNYRGKTIAPSTDLPRDLSCADFTGATLDGVELSQRQLAGAILRNASLKEANLRQAHLEYADLRGADLSEADLGQMQADHADLRKAVLIDADLRQAEFPHADLTEAKLTRAQLTQVNFTDATLVGADLTESTPGQMRARGADFSRASLREAELSQAHMEHTSLKGADVREAEFTQAELDGADFTGALVEGASFIQADEVDLTGAKGTPKGIDALVPTVEQEPEIPGDIRRTDPYEPTAPVSSGPSAGLVLVVLSAIGLLVTGLVWAGAYQRRSRAAAAYAIARRAAEEDVTRLGEEIDRLDYEFQISGPVGPTADRDWRYALDAYEAAKNALAHARSMEHLSVLRGPGRRRRPRRPGEPAGQGPPPLIGAAGRRRQDPTPPTGTRTARSHFATGRIARRGITR